MLTLFRTAASQIRPMEVIYDRESISEQIFWFIKAQPIPPQMIAFG
jgi:hypothetical protein